MNKKQYFVVPVVQVVNNQTITTSIEIANVFSKQHKDVLETIRCLNVPESFSERNFPPVEYLDAKGEMRPAYNLTRDGFTILAMGFTGKRAMQFKIAYIEAFNKMEVQLMQKRFPELPAPGLTPDQQRQVQQLIGEKVYATKNKAMYPMYFKQIYRAIKDEFKVGKYNQVPAAQFDELVGYVGEIGMAKPTLCGESDLIHMKDISDVADGISDELQAATKALFLVQAYVGRILQDVCVLMPRGFAEMKRRKRIAEPGE